MTSPSTTSVLALVQVAPDLLPALEGALGKVWAGRTIHADAITGGPPEPVLAFVGGTDPGEVLQRAQQAARVAPDVPFVAIVPNARHLRTQRGLPPNVAWALTADELEPRILGLAMRCALEFGHRRKLERQLHTTRVAADAGWAATAAAHEIGNPLTSLLTNLELARAQLSANVHRGEGIDLASLLMTVQDGLDGARHVSRLAQDLGRVSRGTGRVVPIDAKAVLDTARRLTAEPLAGVVVHMLGRRSAMVRADETRLCQAFLNLFKNAGHAMAGRPKSRIDVEIEVDEGEVVVRFTDNGPGIPDDVADRLFEAGYTTRAEGTGLGLALSRGFLEQMGGSLVCVPHTGGARFEVRLPGAAVAGGARPTLVPDRNPASARVLVVDDAPLVRRAIERALSGIHRVQSAAGIDEAMADIESNLFDVVFVDLHISGRSGIEFYERVQQSHPDRVRKFVFLSGGFGQEEIAYLDAHGLPWVRKPLGADELRELVADLSARR